MTETLPRPLVGAAPQLRSPEARVSRFSALIIAAFRLATLAQMLPSLAVAVRTSPDTALCALTWIVALGALAAGAVVNIVTGRVAGTRLAIADVLIAVALLGGGVATVPVEDRTGTWIGFQCAYALAVACSAIGVRRPALWCSMVAALAAGEVVYLAPLWDEPPGVGTVLGNLLTLLILAPVFWIGTGLIHRMAQEASEARREAVRLAREAEERRARAAIHNGTAIMRLLLEYDASGSGDDAARARLRDQAEVEMNRMRAYLSGAPTRPLSATASLRTVLQGVAEEFVDLPIQLVTGLATDDQLAPALSHDLGAALRSLLLNVRQYAHATEVVLHATETGGAKAAPGDGDLPAHRPWVVTVHDDGIGFDTSSTRLGVGLGDLVVRQLQDHGVTTQISSIPGLGTTVTLRSDGTGAADAHGPLGVRGGLGDGTAG